MHGATHAWSGGSGSGSHATDGKGPDASRRTQKAAALLQDRQLMFSAKGAICRCLAAISHTPSA